MSYEQIPNWSYSGKPLYTQIIKGGTLTGNSGRVQTAEPNLIELPLGNGSEDLPNNPRYTLVKGLYDAEGNQTDNWARYKFYNESRNLIGQANRPPSVGNDGSILYRFGDTWAHDGSVLYYSVDNQSDQMGGIKRRKTQRSKGKRRNRRSRRR